MMNTMKLNDVGLLITRVAFSAMFLTHGISKAQQLFSGEEIQFPSVLGLGATLSLILAVIGEVLCPILIIIGFKTRLVAIPAVITMFVAAFVIHGDDPFGKKEFALLYLFGFLAIAFLGAGRYSLDGSMNK